MKNNVAAHRQDSTDTRLTLNLLDFKVPVGTAFLDNAECYSNINVHLQHISNLCIFICKRKQTVELAEHILLVP